MSISDKKIVNGEKSFAKLFDLLEAIANSSGGLSGRELSQHTSIPVSTVFRMLKFLCGKDYLNVDRGIYTLGSSFVRLGNTACSQNPLLKAARPFLEELSRHTRETVHLAKLQEDKVVYADKVEGSRTLRMGSMIGKYSPLHCTGVGKVLLAFQKESRREELLNRMDCPIFTKHTITDIDELRKELTSIRKRGFAIDQCEHEEWVYCLAAPVLDRQGNILAAVSISGAEMYLKDNTERLAGLLTTAAKQISRNL